MFIGDENSFPRRQKDPESELVPKLWVSCSTDGLTPSGYFTDSSAICPKTNRPEKCLVTAVREGYWTKLSAVSKFMEGLE